MLFLTFYFILFIILFDAMVLCLDKLLGFRVVIDGKTNFILIIIYFG